MSDAVRAFDAIAPGYDSWYQDPKGRLVFKAEKRAVEAMLPESGVGVELGAGTGIFAESLTGKKRTVICIDLSREMLERATHRQLPSILASVNALPIRPGVLDFAYMVTVMEFLPEPMDSFAEALGALRAEAPLVCLFINADSSWGALYASMGKQGDPVFRHARLYTPGEVEGKLSGSGFDVVEVVGTLTTDPQDAEVGGEIIQVGTRAGVVLMKAVRLS